MCVRVGAWVYVVCVCVCVHSWYSQALTWVHVCMGVCRQVLLYIFYGTYQTDWGNPAPIVGAIHYDIQNGSYRFCGTVEIAFKQLLEILRADPKQGELLTDLGEGTASEAYLSRRVSGTRPRCGSTYSRRTAWPAMQTGPTLRYGGNDSATCIWCGTSESGRPIRSGTTSGGKTSLSGSRYVNVCVHGILTCVYMVY